MTVLALSIAGFPISANPTWEGSIYLSSFRIYGDVTEALLPVAMVCAASLLSTGMWLLAVGTHLRSGDARYA